MRIKYNLNYNWYFKEKYEENDINTINEYRIVDIPHTLKMLPYNCFNLEDYLFTSSYKKILNIKKNENKRYLLSFLGIAQSSHIYLNKLKICDNYCGYNEINLDVTDYLIDGVNELYLIVSSKEDYFPPFGNTVDYLGYGGIYREVYLYEVSETFMLNPFIYTENLLDDNRVLHFSVDFNNNSKNKVNLLIKDDDSIIIDKDFICESGFDYTSSFNKPIYWSIDNPKLYGCIISLYNNENNKIDELTFKYGFRDIKVDKYGLYLNGVKTLIRGLNRHQSYPYVGYAMPKSMQLNDIRILKEELGVNAFRCSHYMNSKDVLDECDRIGLLVYEEFPGWQYIGNNEWKIQAIKNLESMIYRDRYHPSIIFFGVRINESVDDFLFNKDCYLRAKELDPSRIITGTRNIKKGLDFDDCYTYNNFNNNLNKKGLESKSLVTKSKNPYLVSEFGGHMYPNKQYDNALRRLNAARLHYNIINKTQKSNNMIGSIGWVFADYNTHKEFGSSDMICYHGVTDMFRNFKESANVYRVYSKKPFLEVSDTFNCGDNNKLFAICPYIYTNCDRVEVYDNDTLLQCFTTNDNIDSRIVKFNDQIGDLLETKEKLPHHKAKMIKKNIITAFNYDCDIFKTIIHSNVFYLGGMIKYLYKYCINSNRIFTFKGYIDDKCVIEFDRSNSAYFDKYEVSLNKNTLNIENTYDVIEVSVKTTTNLNSLVKYKIDPVRIEVSDGLIVLGDSTRSIIGGYASFYIRNKLNIDSTEEIKIIFSDRKEEIIKVKVYKNDSCNCI